MRRKLLRIAPLLILAVIILLTGCPGNPNFPPVITKISGPHGTISKPASTFVWDGEDVDDHVLRYEYRKDGSDWANSGSSTAYTWTDYSRGLHTFEVRAQDAGGLYSQIVFWVFYYDTQSMVYPEKPVTVICPWGAGGGTDRITRFVAEKLSSRLEVPFMVENMTGGGGAIGHSAGANADADGYTITMVTVEICTMHWIGLTTVMYDDFDYLVQLNEDNAGVMVQASAPWDNIHELLDYIEANPNELIFSGSSSGSMWDLARIGMLNAAGLAVDSVMWFPTTGAAASIIELLEGGVDVITCSVAEAASQLKSGQLKLLAVMSDKRFTDFPDVPTLKEEGIIWTAGTWRGLAVPMNTPEEVKSILEAEILKIALSNAFCDFMETNGFGVRIKYGEQFRKFAEEQDAILGEVLELGGFID